MSPVDSRTEAPPSSRLSGSPTPPGDGWLSLRPILAGLVVLAVGLPAVWLIARPDLHARPARQAAVVRTPAPTGRAPLPIQPGEPTTLVAVPPRSPDPSRRVPAKPIPSPAEPRPEGHSQPADPDQKADRQESARRAEPSRGPEPSALPQQRARPNTTWIKAECARRFPEDEMRRAYCEAILAQLAP